MRKYALDTNLYIEAIRSVEAAEELTSFYDRFAPGTYLSAIVLHELLIGATSVARSRDIQEQIARPFLRTRRVMTPSAGAWESAGQAIATMVRRDKRDVRTLPKSLVNDYLLAASCRESGVTLITRNVTDFAAISRYIKVKFTAPWPA